MMALPSVMNDWVIEDLPDLLWMDCLVHLHRDRGARLFRSSSSSCGQRSEIRMTASSSMVA